jgi:hypothetical protein
MEKVTAIGTKETKAYRAELSGFIAHHQGLAMVNLEMAKRYWWHPRKRKHYLFLAEGCRSAATDLLNEYRAIWNRPR